MENDTFYIELTDEIDLHHFHAKDIKYILEEFISRAAEKNIYSVKIIHGKGKSVVKKTVLDELSKNKNIISFHDCNGNWGATIALLKKNN